MLDLALHVRTSDPFISIKRTRPGRRRGGKPPAPALIRPLKTSSKRAAFLRWFLEVPEGRAIADAMAAFNMSRPNVLSYWTAIHRDHGVGYSLSGNSITALLPGTIKPCLFQ